MIKKRVRVRPITRKVTLSNLKRLIAEATKGRKVYSNRKSEFSIYSSIVAKLKNHLLNNPGVRQMPTGISAIGQQNDFDEVNGVPLEEALDIESDGDPLTLKFSDDIKVLCLDRLEERILCYYLGIDSLEKIKTDGRSDLPIIMCMMMEAIPNFMNSKGFEFAGEVAFTEDGQLVPPIKKTWTIKGEEHVFTSRGYMFFEKGDERVIIFSQYHPDHSKVICYTADQEDSKQLMTELMDFTKAHNCLRGVKLKDIQLYEATFVEVERRPNYTWDSYYYPDKVRKLFDMEIFGFLKNIEEYNRRGITKRGVILYGKPGCVFGDTKIKVRKKNNEGRHEIIVE